MTGLWAGAIDPWLPPFINIRIAKMSDVMNNKDSKTEMRQFLRLLLGATTLLVSRLVFLECKRG